MTPLLSDQTSPIRCQAMSALRRAIPTHLRGRAPRVLKSGTWTHTRSRATVRVHTMKLPNDNETNMRSEEKLEPEFERLTQEINLLKLEGHLFCFDPREAKR